MIILNPKGECERCGVEIYEDPIRNPEEQRRLPEAEWKAWCSMRCYENDAEDDGMHRINNPITPPPPDDPFWSGRMP